jgi:hypothetical protein
LLNPAQVCSPEEGPIIGEWVVVALGAEMNVTDPNADTARGQVTAARLTENGKRMVWPFLGARGYHLTLVGGLSTTGGKKHTATVKRVWFLTVHNRVFSGNTQRINARGKSRKKLRKWMPEA